MKFYCKPTLTLFLLLYVAIQSAQAQDTLRITLQDAVRIALSDNPTIKVAGQEILLKKEARREAYAGLFPEASLVGSYSRAIKKQSFAMMGEVIEVGTDNTYSGGLSVSLPVFAPALYKSIIRCMDLAMIMSTSTVLKKRLTIRRRWQDSSVTDISVLVLTD